MDRPHILVIEDDLSVCELLFSCLSKADCRVSIAQSGEAGLQQVEEERPDVVVLDLSLPGMNGLDVCRAMRRDPWMSKLPVLMLTGKAEEEDIITGLEVGADDYVTKPFSPKILTARVKTLLRRGSKHPGAEALSESEEQTGAKPELLLVETLGRCELRFADRRLSCPEQLSPAQRQLMAMLVGSRSGRVSQEEVQAAFWPDSSSSRARSSFDSLLSRVRRTLDQGLGPFDSKKHLVLKRGYLNLENCRIDAHEFRRLVRKAFQQVKAKEFWPAEITFSAAFSLWQGTYLPGNYGGDDAVALQSELEQLFQEASMTFARLLAASDRYQPAVKLLRDALRYEPANDDVVRLLYQLCLAQNQPGQAKQIVKQYGEALARENFSDREIQEILAEFPKARAGDDWQDIGR